MKRFDSANCPDSFKEKGMKTASFENSHPTAGLPACAADARRGVVKVRRTPANRDL
jgi:hypothetical protein